MERKPEALITAYAGGPLLVRGDYVVKDGKGCELPPRRRTVALCCCGRSGIKPWCDGSHKELAAE
ncbi:MAG TPA: CDGSH iron-sulfur domain-containing protein [Actinomycetota bacterium]|nr:CDGSH iron-sulfur domain-containing protein [Actinomycetota bacterium]